MRRAPLAHSLLLAAAGLAALEPAAAAGDARRKVVVLEFRARSQAAPNIGARIAEVLTRASRLDVMGPDEARQRFGAALDAEVTRCRGEAACVARLGARLGTDEVLLVGVSELGDVILTLQRIDSGKAEVAARLAEALPPGAGPAAARLEAYLRRVFPAADFQRYGTIRVATGVAGAAVFLGRRRVGETPLSPIRVKAPADYSVTVRKSGFADFRADIAVGADSQVEVRPELAALSSDAWYKKWWVLAIAGAVTVGAVGAAVLATRGSDGIPVRVEGF